LLQVTIEADGDALHADFVNDAQQTVSPPWFAASFTRNGGINQYRAHDLKFAGALEFADDGTLFVGDNYSGAIFALQLGQSAATADIAPISVLDIDTKIADLLGIVANALEINDMAAHPTTNEVYISVTRSGNYASRPAIVKVKQDSTLELVDLASINFTKQELESFSENQTTFQARGLMGTPPSPRDLAKGEVPLSSLAIMEMEYHDGELFVTSNSRSPQVIPVNGLNGAPVVTDADFERGPKLDAGPVLPFGPVGEMVMFEGISLEMDRLGDDHFVSLTRDGYTGSLNLDTNPTFFPNRVPNLVAEYDFPQWYTENGVDPEGRSTCAWNVYRLFWP
jgi:hypothetical protein